MHRYFIHLAYQGSQFRGWQRQKNVRSVQQVLEEKCGHVLKCSIKIHGCGRTDAGVHASQYVGHFEVEKDLDAAIVRMKINYALPDAIRLYDIIKVESYRNSQFHATQRTYHYYLHNYASPFLNNLSTKVPQNLDWRKMEEAFYLLESCRDFKGFCLTPDKHKSTLVELKKLHWGVNKRGDGIRLTFNADRFLKGMIRILVYYIIKIGKAEYSLTELREKIANPSCQRNLLLAPPDGLYLSGVNYDFIEFNRQPEFLSIDFD